MPNDIDSFKDMIRRLLKSLGVSDSSIEELLDEFERASFNENYGIENMDVSDTGLPSVERLIDVVDEDDRVRVLIELREGDRLEPKLRLIDGGRGLLVYLNTIPEYVRLGQRVTLDGVKLRVNNGVLIIELNKR